MNATPFLVQPRVRNTFYFPVIIFKFSNTWIYNHRKKERTSNRMNKQTNAIKKEGNTKELKKEQIKKTKLKANENEWKRIKERKYWKKNKKQRIKWGKEEKNTRMNKNRPHEKRNCAWKRSAINGIYIPSCHVFQKLFFFLFA